MQTPLPKLNVNNHRKDYNPQKHYQNNGPNQKGSRPHIAFYCQKYALQMHSVIGNGIVVAARQMVMHTLQRQICTGDKYILANTIQMIIHAFPLLGLSCSLNLELRSVCLLQLSGSRLALPSARTIDNVEILLSELIFEE